MSQPSMPQPQIEVLKDMTPDQHERRARTREAWDKGDFDTVADNLFDAMHAAQTTAECVEQAIKSDPVPDDEFARLFADAIGEKP